MEVNTIKKAKHIIGILSIIFCQVLIFKSVIINMVNSLEGYSQTNSYMGFLTAFFILVGGIVSVAGRNSKVCTIVCIFLYALGGIPGVLNEGMFDELYIWSGVCVFLTAFFIISLFVQKYPEKKKTENIDGDKL